MSLPLPKNPKVTDLVPFLAGLDQRLAELEAYVGGNDDRINSLEDYFTLIAAERGQSIVELEAAVAEQKTGTQEQRREVGRLRADSQRLRWKMAHGRKP